MVTIGYLNLTNPNLFISERITESTYHIYMFIYIYIYIYTSNIIDVLCILLHAYGRILQHSLGRQ
jgi:hypothetical protein